MSGSAVEAVDRWTVGAAGGEGWSVERLRATAGALHARPLPEPVARAAWICEPVGPALVLGSAQQAEPDPGTGVEVVRRRSGGGAVWVAPGECLWVDVVLPRHDPLWVDDVGRSGLWLGEAWAAALDAVGVRGAEVHRGPMRRSELSASVCFAGLAAGEVTAGPGGPKLVGVSQRRTRAAARFQCVAYARWDPGPVVAALGLGAAVAGGALAHAGAGVGPGLAALEAAFLAALPA